MDIISIKQPQYYRDFHCVGSDCIDNCCYSWRIIWKKNEIDKLRTSPNLTPELEALIDRAFTTENAPEGSLLIAFDENKHCPFQTEDNLCRIQKELGVEYMSQTCMVYPRLMFVGGSTVYRTCSSSCREVMHRLINDEKAMNLVNNPVRENTTVPVDIFSEKDLTERPELKYRSELFEFFYNLIGDKRQSVETNIIIGALAAQALTKLVNNGGAEKIPEAISDLKAQAHNAEQIRSIENIKPNYHLRFGIISGLLREVVGSSAVVMLNDKTGTPNIDHYNVAEKRLHQKFADRPFFLRNIALNILFETKVPFNFKDRSIFENYSLFAAAYACIRLNMTALAITGDGGVNLETNGRNIHYDGDSKYYGLNAMICRNLFHNPQRQEEIIDQLNEKGFTTPAYIALLVK